MLRKPAPAPSLDDRLGGAVALSGYAVHTLTEMIGALDEASAALFQIVADADDEIDRLCGLANGARDQITANAAIAEKLIALLGPVED